MALVRAGARLRCGAVLSRPILFLALASLTLLVAGCQLPGTSHPQAAGSQQVTVAVVPGFENAPLQVAVKQGLFTQHGLNVTVQTFATLQEAYSALASGQAQVISGDYAGLLYMQAHAPGTRLRLIADGYDATPGLTEVLTLPGSSITSPQDLENQKVATPPHDLAPFSNKAPYNMETLTAEAVLQSDGVSPSSVHWQPMPPGSMIDALLNHKVSAIVATEPYVLQAETKLGAVELFDACSGVTASLPLSGYFTTARYAGGHALALRAFQAALGTAKASSAQLGPVQAVLRTLPGMSTREADLVTIGQYPAFLSVGQVQRVADLMSATGMITTQVTVRSLLFR
jgi:NitT/TauT family transport system substrate-binding protein